MRAFITGGYGFAGRHLAHHLVSCGDDVAVGFHPSERIKDGETPPLGSIPLPRTVQTLALDITDRDGVFGVIALLKPDVIYHLAAITFVPEGEQDSKRAFEVNTFGTINLLDAVATHSPQTRFLYVSSAEVYGEPRPGTLPLTEQVLPRPISAYGVAKAAADLIAYKYAFIENVHTVRVRPFNHTGPGQNEHFALSNFAKQIAAIKLGRAEPVIKVGTLEVKRDYSDVSDIVRGYREAILNGKRGDVYNLCSGQSVEMKSLLESLIKISEVDVKIEVEESRVRPVLVPDLYGSYQKAQKEIGWKPRIDIDGTLHSLFAYWLETLGREKKK